MFATVAHPVVPMRKSQNLLSEVVSEALFGEKVSIQKIEEQSAFIHTSDSYSGWVDVSSFVYKDYPTTHYTNSLKTYLYQEKSIIFGPFLSLPFGVRLHVLQEIDEKWKKVELPDGKVCYTFAGNLSQFHPLKKEELPLFSKLFLRIPYTWGGRSSFGFDCSGFVQMLYGQLGLRLPRDAKDQYADDRLKTIRKKDLAMGDLIFWGKSEEKIEHVGLYIGDDQFIHATIQEHKPWLRISSLYDPFWQGSGAKEYPFRIYKSLK